MTSPLFPPAARMLQRWAEALLPLDISTVDQAREKNSWGHERAALNTSNVHDPTLTNTAHS